MKFAPLDPRDVLLGRARTAFLRRMPYREALLAGDAGRVECDQRETIRQVKTQLKEAAQEVGISIRISIERGERSLVWKKAERQRRSQVVPFPGERAIA